MYRYLLSSNENNPITVADELSFTHSYTYILKEHFEDALYLDIHINPEMIHKYIPPLSLQIRFEKTIKHNIVSSSRPLHIRIYNEGADLLVVENNLQNKRSVEDSTGKGLMNITDRYQLLANQSIGITQDSTFGSDCRCSAKQT